MKGPIVITGAGRGIGAATARLVAQQGHAVCVNYRANRAAAEADLHASGGEPGRVDRVRAQVPMQRGGTPTEVAHAIWSLLAPEASYITGALLDVAGGR